MELNERAKEPVSADDVILKITHSHGFEVECITNKTPEGVQEIMAALTKLEDKNTQNIRDCLESCGADYIPVIVGGGRKRQGSLRSVSIMRKRKETRGLPLRSLTHRRRLTHFLTR